MSSSGAREDAVRLVLCEHCAQAIAERTAHGVRPIGCELRFDARLRPVLICPKCGRHTRISKPKAA